MIKKWGLAIVLALGLTACGAADEPAANPAAQPSDPGVGHVHGLGVDPATGKTYIAGHFGLFTLESGKLVRVGDRDADHMGFTVAGPKTFYASGHPAAGDITAGQSPHLGLIRSTDSGLNWEQVALAGQADFHALQVAGTTAYGYDSQTGQIWYGQGSDLKPAARLDLLDLAIGTDAPDRLYATTPDGVKVSTDSGKSFKALKGAPLLSFLDVTGKDSLVGVAPDGQVQSSADRGATWQPTGRLPMQAVAFTAVSADRLLAAAMDGTVYESVNGGKDFTTVYQP
ncbi:F510_1955 family glycosylhydrolase [Nonomuraea sp. H19]|uniref:F510_1955 family glycosylhydrolase n=1 Tax=Nonomuraea sp. H19 TaxID=3452206 RepID=UPI003F888C77